MEMTFGVPAGALPVRISSLREGCFEDREAMNFGVEGCKHCSFCCLQQSSTGSECCEPFCEGMIKSVSTGWSRMFDSKCMQGTADHC